MYFSFARPGPGGPYLITWLHKPIKGHFCGIDLFLCKTIAIPSCSTVDENYRDNMIEFECTRTNIQPASD